MHNPWPKFEFGQFCTFRNGLNFTQQERGHTVKVVGVSDFWECNLLTDFSTISTVSLSSAPSSDDLLTDGDLLFVRSNGNKALVGRCMLVFPGTEQVSFSGFTIRGRLESNEFNPYFIGYLFQSDLFRKHLMKEGAGTNISNLNQAMLSRFIISKPTLVEQNRIVEILRTWDSAIEKTERLNALALTRFRGTQQRLFGHTAMKGEGWTTSSLARIADRVRRKSDGAEHPVMTISGKSGFLRQDEKFSRFMAGESVENYTLLNEGEFAYNKGNSKTYPQGCIYRLEQTTALVPHVYISFRLHNGLNSDFYAHLFQSGFLNRQLARLINSGVRNDGLLNLNIDDFFGCVVPVPPLDQQGRIANLFETAKRELTILEGQLRRLQRQKRGLMQKLLTGEWRVPLRDRKVEQLAEGAVEEITP
jgi:type I restriction enzyme S subunit